MSEDRVEELELEVAERRREVEARLARLRAAFASEVGVAPRRRGWLLVLLAAGAGTALALRRGRRGRRREDKRIGYGGGRRARHG